MTLLRSNCVDLSVTFFHVTFQQIQEEMLNAVSADDKLAAFYDNLSIKNWLLVDPVD